MSNRLKTNGFLARANPSGLKEAYDNSSKGMASKSEKKFEAEQPSQLIKEKIESFVKNSPGKTLLFALAAGVALGWLVKRS